MRNYLFLTGLAAVALTTSCSEDFDLLGNRHEVTLSASVTAEGTRAAFNLDGTTAKFYWNTGDQIGVTSTGSANNFSSFTLKGEGGSATATFTGIVSGEVTDACYAVYPFNKSHSMSGNTLSYVFPSSYTYTKVSSEFFPGTADCNSFNPAMWAKVGSDKSISFKHLGGIFVIRFPSMPLEEGTLKFSATEQMAGTFTADLSSNDEITCKNTETNVTGSSKEVSITFSGATKGADGVFYVPVPVGTYTNIYVELYEKDATMAKQSVSAGSFSITRKLLQALKLNGEMVTGDEAKTASSATEATNALVGNNNVAITSITATESGTATAEITIPEITTSTETEATVTKTVAVEKISENVSITLKDAVTEESTDKKSVDAVVLSIPNIPVTESNKEKLPNVTVAMPSSTVTLAGNAGAANFGTVTAETAENTLVVSSGVTIQKLVVKKGNVRIESGAKVVAIEKASDAADGFSPVIYCEIGATLPSSTTDFTVEHVIENESDFMTARKTAGSYKLMNDVTLSKNLAIEKEVTIDLNGKTLTAGTILPRNGGHLTLKNGKITAARNGYLMAGDNGTLTLDKVTYDGTTCTSSCILINPHTTNATINIKNNSTIKGNWYALSANAEENKVSEGCKYNLENSEFIAGETGVMINIPATVTMKNCKASGNHQGALLRGGTYAISDCIFTLNATLDTTHKDYKWMTTWGSGNKTAFAALTIGNYLNGAYKYETKIDFTGTNKAVVTGTNATSFPAIHVCANGSNYPVTIMGFKDNIMTTDGGKSTAIEYGTDNITVDGSKATVNVQKAE